MTTIEGSRFWEINIDEYCAKVGIPRDKIGMVSWFFLDVPWAHPFWSGYNIYMIHLRDIEGAPPPDISPRIKDPTHQIFVMALDPEVPIQQQLDELKPRYLHPTNFTAQMKYASDEEAIMATREAVAAVMNGTLSPDTDFIRSWVERFNDSCVKR